MALAAASRSPRASAVGAPRNTSVARNVARSPRRQLPRAACGMMRPRDEDVAAIAITFGMHRWTSRNLSRACVFAGSLPLLARNPPRRRGGAAPPRRCDGHRCPRTATRFLRPASCRCGCPFASLLFDSRVHEIFLRGATIIMRSRQVASAVWREHGCGSAPESAQRRTRCAVARSPQRLFCMHLLVLSLILRPPAFGVSQPHRYLVA